MKKLLRAMFRHFGFDIRRLPSSDLDAFFEQQRLLQASSPSVIFDVGAHHGETAEAYRRLFPDADIYSFEPFKESFAQLQAVAARLSGVHAFNFALADRMGGAVLNSNVSSATNSLLATAPEAARVWPGLVDGKDQVRVHATTLDAFCRDTRIDQIDVLKLDVQGAEPLVLKGSEEFLRSGRVRLVYTEILTLPTYIGQTDFLGFLSMMKGYGFDLFNLYNLSSTAAGELRQLDAIFLPSRAQRFQLAG
jgi:FkbM family methyltransferase